VVTKTVADPQLDHDQIAINGIRLHVVQAGPLDGPPVILLHGFPEFWYGWRQQIPVLAAAGYRVWAPDQRGYNLSDKPRGLDAYNLDVLAADVVDLIEVATEAQPQKEASLVGHDWGGAVAWWVAAKYPEKLRRLVVLNCPQGGVLLKHLRHNRQQMRRQWYMFFFQLPWLPEVVCRARNWRMLVNMLQRTSRPGTFSPADQQLYREAWSQPGAFPAMLGWYRAMFQRRPQAAPQRPIPVPTLLLWGARDRFLGRELAQPSIDLCADGHLEFIEGASHWVQHEEPQRVNARIVEFLRPPTS
jgi:pimeloyl-ACP methyl ester carboxylesterase